MKTSSLNRNERVRAERNPRPLRLLKTFQTALQQKLKNMMLAELKNKAIRAHPEMLTFGTYVTDTRDLNTQTLFLPMTNHTGHSYWRKTVQDL